MNRNPFKILGIAALLLLAGFGRPALAQDAEDARPLSESALSQSCTPCWTSG
jgi:hypothetical protein